VLFCSERFAVRLLAPLIPDGIKPGTLFAVEYDPASQWFAVGTTIAAQYLQDGGRVSYLAMARAPEDVKRDLSALGVDVPRLIKDARLVVDDWHSAALAGGRIESGSTHSSMGDSIEGGTRYRSLKIADLSIEWSKGMKSGWQLDDVVETWPPGALGLVESASVLLRFNDEKTFMEWQETRDQPNERRAKRIDLAGYARGIHSESFYKRVESIYDGLIEIRVMEQESEARSFLRLTNLRGQPHDARWHRIEVKRNGEVVLSS
jgi:KaiC/GvpD/RAD55 family RecA-like ATPase